MDKILNRVKTTFKTVLLRKDNAQAKYVNPDGIKQSVLINYNAINHHADNSAWTAMILIQLFNTKTYQNHLVNTKNNCLITKITSKYNSPMQKPIV